MHLQLRRMPRCVLRYVTLSADTVGRLGYQMGEEEARLHASLFWSCGGRLRRALRPSQRTTGPGHVTSTPRDLAYT